MSMMTVRDMRKAINDARAGYTRADGTGKRGTLPPTSAMIQACLIMCQREGLSGEDTMTVLAYHALVGYEKLHDLVMEQISLTVNPPFIIVKPEDPKA